MRVIAGAWRGRRLVAPAGEGTRPTADRARQTVFDVLWHAPWAGRQVIEGARVLDAFAGSGAMGIEALSRGAAEATFLEKDPAALAAIRSNLRACRAEARGRVVRADATAPPPAPAPSGLVFLDPPYGKGLVPAALVALSAAGWIGRDAVVVAEMGAQEDPARPAGFAIADDRVIGAARVLVLRCDR
ncbi:16S rRNA (guanine(966)-N(2))-methyltransferase RsmD [Elioraea sp.]|uniref:16S rRNA (guanine(966)-N(2))-methyltransferase RsmD n=1 Tax=Elioraea sp. TaxID=2185103 RepID=UPI003F7028E5